MNACGLGDMTIWRLGIRSSGASSAVCCGRFPCRQAAYSARKRRPWSGTAQYPTTVFRLQRWPHNYCNLEANRCCAVIHCGRPFQFNSDEFCVLWRIHSQNSADQPALCKRQRGNSPPFFRFQARFQVRIRGLGPCPRSNGRVRPTFFPYWPQGK